MDAITHLSGSVTLQAMALDVPNTPGHPNKHPFKGILTRIDEPSDKPPEGSQGHRVVLTRAAAEKALSTLLGMGVDYQSDLAGHNPKAKIGFIEKADIVGDAIHIEGFLYAADFPDEVSRITSAQRRLGFSYEMTNILVADINALHWEITECVFTGAAILFKDKAAYSTTSLAAQAEENTMDKESLDAITKLLDDKLNPVTTRLDKIEASQTEAAAKLNASAQHRTMVEPHATALENVADAMAKDGIGGHPTRGHIHACRAMAEHLRARASMGELASEWPGYSGFHAAAAPETKADPAKEKEIAELKDSVASLTTKITDIQAAATKTSTEPERKTLSPAINALLAKAGIELPSDGSKKMSIVEVDKVLDASGLPSSKRMEIKAAMTNNGLLS